MKGYCVRTFPMRYTINFGICRLIICIGSDAKAYVKWSQILGANVKKNGKGSKCWNQIFNFVLFII